MSPLVSILITTKDQSRFLERSLPAIFSQTIKNVEVILLDSSETENYPTLFKNFPVKIIRIDPKTFNYSVAANKGAKASKGKFLVRVSGDVVPKNNVWLANLIANFKDEKIGGVYSRWVNDERANLFDRSLNFLSMRKQKLVFTKAPNWSAASGALKKALWQKYHFNENLQFCDDLDWSRRIQKAGYVIVYEPESIVYHSHNENALAIVMRGLRTIRALLKIYLT